MTTTIARWRRAIWMVAGVGLLVGGAFLLNGETPHDNVVLSQTSVRRLAIESLGFGRVDRYSLVSDRNPLSRASAIDLDLSFQFRVRRFPSTSSAPAIATFGRLVIGLPSDGILNATDPFVTGAYIQNMGYVAPNLWQSFRLVGTRSRSLTEWFNGLQQYSFTVDEPFWALAPNPVVIGVRGGLGTSIEYRNFHLTVQTFGPAGARQSAANIRVLQIIAMLMIAVGAGSIATGILGGLVPVAKRNRNSLALIAIGVLVGGILANVSFALVAHPPAESHTRLAWWLYEPNWRFGDYFQTLGLLRSRAPYGFQGGTYPPVGYWIIAPFESMSNYASLFTVEAVAIGLVAWWSWRAIAGGFSLALRVVTVLAVLFSLPITFALDRGNVDLLVLLILLIAAAALQRRRNFLSAAMFGVAGAAKALPIFYLAAFLRLGKLRALVFGLAIAAGLTVSAFVGFGPFSSIHTQFLELRTSLRYQTDLYRNPGVSTPFSSSVMSFLQAVGYAVNGSSGAASVASHIQRYVSLEEIVGTSLLLAYLVFVERSVWRSASVITIGILLLPEFSGYYSLVYLLPALALFAEGANFNRRTIGIAILFGLLLAPRAYAFFGAPPLIDSSVLLTAPLLMTLAGFVAFDGVAERGGALSIVRDSRDSVVKWLGRPVSHNLSLETTGGDGQVTGSSIMRNTSSSAT